MSTSATEWSKGAREAAKHLRESLQEEIAKAKELVEHYSASIARNESVLETLKDILVGKDHAKPVANVADVPGHNPRRRLFKPVRQLERGFISRAILIALRDSSENHPNGLLTHELAALTYDTCGNGRSFNGYFRGLSANMQNLMSHEWVNREFVLDKHGTRRISRWSINQAGRDQIEKYMKTMNAA